MIVDKNKQVIITLITVGYILFLLFLLFWINTFLFDFLLLHYSIGPLIIALATLTSLYNKKLALFGLAIVILVGLASLAFYGASGIGCIDTGLGCLRNIEKVTKLFVVFTISSLLIILLKNLRLK